MVSYLKITSDIVDLVSIKVRWLAICFKCWKLVKITKVEPRKEYYNNWGRWAYEVESEDLMKNH